MTDSIRQKEFDNHAQNMVDRVRKNYDIDHIFTGLEADGVKAKAIFMVVAEWKKFERDADLTQVDFESSMNTVNPNAYPK